MIDIKIDDSEVLDALQRLIDAGANPAPALADIGEYLVDSTKNRFAAGEAPDGTPWAPLSPVTVARKGHSVPLIGESHRLSTEISYRLTDSGVEVGSPLEYAATQQFGASKGEFGQFSLVRTKQVVPVPWGDIPARPFLGLSADDKTAVLDILQEYLQVALNG